MGQPRASPPPRGDVTMPEPQSSWAGSAHSPVKTALIGRASAGRAGPVGGRTPSWPGLRLLSPRSGAPQPARCARPGSAPRHGEPGPAPLRARSWPRPPEGGALLLPPLPGRARRGAAHSGGARRPALPLCRPPARASEAAARLQGTVALHGAGFRCSVLFCFVFPLCIVCTFYVVNSRTLH